MPNDDFYIGYLAQAPQGLAKKVRLYILLLLGAAAVTAVVVVAMQQPFYPSTYEFLNYRSFEGVISESPYPTLLVDRPGEPGEDAPHSRYYLVAEGKHGAQEAVSGLDGKRVRLEGTLVYRDDQTMLEIVDGTVEEVSAADTLALAAGKSLGTHTLVGEIVDSKCFLGVMNPGNLKPHRACASLCIRGGIPPVLAVRDRAGRASYLMLQGPNGQTVNEEVLDLVAEPVEITGEVIRYDNLLVLKADPASFQRLH